VLLPTNRRLLTNVRLPRPAAVCCSAANLQCHCVDEMFLQCHLPEVTAISPCLKWLLSEVPNTSTPGPIPVAFTRTRVIVDIFGAIDFTPLQDAFTPFLGARNFHEEQERCFPCVLSDFRLWFVVWTLPPRQPFLGPTPLLSQLRPSLGTIFISGFSAA